MKMKFFFFSRCQSETLNDVFAALTACRVTTSALILGLFLVRLSRVLSVGHPECLFASHRCKKTFHVVSLK